MPFSLNEKIVIASNNKKKIAELSAILTKLGLTAVPQSELGIDLIPEEDGLTFMDNARIKARAVYDACRLPTIADDSGLVVYALNGEPGVHSARYGGEGLDDGGRTCLLLKNMESVPDDNRGAAFVSAVCLVLDAAHTVEGEGRIEGEILREQRGDGGFGYDPVFYLPAYEQTFAELPADVKNTISHRAHALAAFEKNLKKERQQ